MMLHPVGPLPTRSGSSGPDDYDLIASLSRRLSGVLAGAEPAQYRLLDVVDVLAEDSVAKMAGLPEPRWIDTMQAARYLGHDVPMTHSEVTDPTQLLLEVQSDRTLAWRRQQVVSAVERGAVDSTSAEGCGYLPPGVEGRLVTVRIVQRTCRARWVTSWGLRGHLEALAASGSLVPASTQVPATAWYLPAATEAVGVAR